MFSSPHHPGSKRLLEPTEVTPRKRQVLDKTLALSHSASTELKGHQAQSPLGSPIQLHKFAPLWRDPHNSSPPSSPTAHSGSIQDSDEAIDVVDFFDEIQGLPLIDISDSEEEIDVVGVSDSDEGEEGYSRNDDQAWTSDSADNNKEQHVSRNTLHRRVDPDVLDLDSDEEHLDEGVMLPVVEGVIDLTGSDDESIDPGSHHDGQD
ncbi:hypothetical protein FRC06_005911, partial [Ceratobasidium sp. 370]